MSADTAVWSVIRVNDKCILCKEKFLILTYLAVVAFKAVSADALVHADFVDAGASVAAGVTLTVVDVYAKKEDIDDASVSVHLVFKSARWYWALLSWQ